MIQSLLWLILLITQIQASRVLEVSDRFLEIYQKDQRQWLIMFYAPWCHHCQKMEATYMNVAQTLDSEHIDVAVGRIDCTRFSNVASHFNVSGFPTILYVSSEKIVEYSGDRKKEELLDFTRRLSGPAVRAIRNCEELSHLRSKHSVFFIRIGTTDSSFENVARKHQSTTWFYAIGIECPGYRKDTVYSVKTSSSGRYIRIEHDETSGKSLDQWTVGQKFPVFVKVTSMNLHSLLLTEKLLVIALVKEFEPVEKLAEEHAGFRDSIEDIATKSVSSHLIFAWTSALSTMNSIAMQSIDKLPSLIVINSKTFEYYLLDDLHVDQIESLLEDLEHKPHVRTFRGGRSFHHRIYRVLFDGYSNLSLMYKGNPILTLLMFGLPLFFFLAIIYTTCCTDMLDTAEEEEPDDTHQKND